MTARRLDQDTAPRARAPAAAVPEAASIGREASGTHWRREQVQAAGFQAGRYLGRQRVGGVWVDRQPPEGLPRSRWAVWMDGYLDGLRERALRGGQTPYLAGRAGFLSGFWRSDNPYPAGTEPHEAWRRGWLEACRAASVATRAVKLSRTLRRASR